jgi:two-component system nitrogen regulation sensor histidine kinase NtrY
LKTKLTRRLTKIAVKRLAHEIKNPLTPISLHLERLRLLAQKDKLSKEEVINVCGLLLEEISRIKSAVNYFRDLSYQREIKVEGFELRRSNKGISKAISLTWRWRW